MYECHVTIQLPEREQGLKIARAYYEGLGRRHQWKTSYIVNDPLLGKGGYFYFTAHHVDYDTLFSKMEALAFGLGTLVVRKKIEQIIYDTKRELVNVHT